jgi:hypothetical protein
VLGFGSYETARAWLHKLGRAMVLPDRDRLSGVVEVNEAFVGGVSVGRQAGSTDIVPVMSAVERLDNKRLGRMRAQASSAACGRPATSTLDHVVTGHGPPSQLRASDRRLDLRRLSRVNTSSLWPTHLVV